MTPRVNCQSACLPPYFADMTRTEVVPKLVVLLHGWLSRPGTFGRLPKMLAERGHAVLPLFHTFDSFSRGVTIEELADRLEAVLKRERRDRPTVLIAHSMGGLVAIVWMLRYHAEKGHRPPVERLVTFGTPRHGVCLRPFARAFIRWGLVPGTALARQMQAPNPFLWDLAWSELQHASLLPPMVTGAGLLRRANPISMLIGGRESDGVVPTICAQPHSLFVTADGRRQTLPPRSFHVFEGRAHSGPRGLYAGLKAPDRDARTALLLAAVEERSKRASDNTDDPANHLTRAMLVVRHPPRTRLELTVEPVSSEERRLPDAQHEAGLSLFLIEPGTVSVFVYGHDMHGAKGRHAISSKRIGIPVRHVTYLDLSSEK